jgi:hypothetical protein
MTISLAVEGHPFLPLQSPAMHPGASFWPTLAALLVGGLALAYVQWRSDFVVRVRDGQCRFTGNLPLARRKALAQFLLDDVQPSGPVSIRGRVRDGCLRLRFQGR